MNKVSDDLIIIKNFIIHPEVLILGECLKQSGGIGSFKVKDTIKKISGHI